MTSKKRPGQPIHRRWWFWLAAVLVGAGVLFGALRKDTGTTRARAVHEALPAFVYDEIGTTANWDNVPSRLRGFNLEKRPDGYFLFLYLRAHDAATKADIRRGILEDARALVERLSHDTAFDSISTYRITSFLLLPDEDSTFSEVGAARVMLTRAAAQDVRWDTLTADGFERWVRAEGELRFHTALE